MLFLTLNLVMRPTMQNFKTFIYVTVGSMLLLIYLFICLNRMPDKNAYPQLLQKINTKFILQWTPRVNPFNLIPKGFQANCKHSNCFVTDVRNFLPYITDFDAVLFSGTELVKLIDLPPQRLAEQKYVFAATESAHNFPVCDTVYDGYFNWTWTYKVDSDFRWGYITVYDLQENEFAPQVDMVWPELKPIGDELKMKLSNKTKFVAWFVSNCKSMGKRERFVEKLNSELQNYDWAVDIYGRCGTHRCPRSREKECFDMLERDYYFYLSFENSFSEDYVTEKLLTALNHYTVPIVYGSANYSRFLPPGSYLNALELGPQKLAATMDAIYRNKTAYYDFFRWRNHYQYKLTTLQDVCRLCDALNDEGMMKNHSSHQNFRRWWNGAMWNGQESTCRIT